MPKAEKDKTEKAAGLGRTREEKWDQTGSPEILDRGETSEMPRPPFRGCSQVSIQCTKNSVHRASVTISIMSMA